MGSGPTRVCSGWGCLLWSALQRLVERVQRGTDRRAELRGSDLAAHRNLAQRVAGALARLHELRLRRTTGLATEGLRTLGWRQLTRVDLREYHLNLLDLVRSCPTLLTAPKFRRSQPHQLRQLRPREPLTLLHEPRADLLAELRELLAVLLRVLLRARLRVELRHLQVRGRAPLDRTLTGNRH